MNRYLTLLLVTLIAVVSCKKVVEDQKKDAVLDIMTGGQWYVQSYIEAGADITAQFENYRFQFLEDGKVTAVNGSFTASGTWIGDVSNYSIISDFPSAGDPLKKLNGTWKLKDSGESFVVAEMTAELGKMQLRLEKSP